MRSGGSTGKVSPWLFAGGAADDRMSAIGGQDGVRVRPVPGYPLVSYLDENNAAVRRM